MSTILTGLAAARREGRPYGIASVCSAHPVVLRAALRRAAGSGSPVLIEATCNEVNLMRAVGTGAALAKRGLAMVFPPYALHPHMSMRNNIAISVENGEDGSGCD